MRNKRNFLRHLSNPLRRKIAVNYVQYEFRKFFPQLRNQAVWKIIDKDIEKWWQALFMRNFWNGAHGISMGFHLKSLVPWITSKNVHWEEKEMPVKELKFGWKFPPSKYWKSKELKTAPRDHFPIFVIRKEGELRVIDGNRRLLKAIIDKKKTIRAFVGEPIAKPALYEHWVPTSLLVDLVFWHKHNLQAGRDITKITARMIAELIRDSSAGRKEFRERAIHRNDEIHMRLLRAVDKFLKL